MRLQWDQVARAVTQSFTATPGRSFGKESEAETAKLHERRKGNVKQVLHNSHVQAAVSKVSEFEVHLAPRCSR